ncbi:hypothetical protein AB7Y51_26310, partial [Escherichia coli]
MGYISEENAAPLHFNHPAGSVAEGHGTATPTGSAEPSPKPTFSFYPYLYQLCIFHETKRMFFMQIGYIRVSTNDQNTDLQRNAL